MIDILILLAVVVVVAVVAFAFGMFVERDRGLNDRDPW